MATVNVDEKSREVWPFSFRDMRADRQTDRCILITILCSRPIRGRGGKLKHFDVRYNTVTEHAIFYIEI